MLDVNDLLTPNLKIEMKTPLSDYIKFLEANVDLKKEF